MKTKNNHRFGIIILTAALLLIIPFIAMKFTDDVSWSLIDFIVAGTLLFTTGVTIELIIRNISNKYTRIILCIIALLLLVAIWAELAVGIFDIPVISGS